MYSYVYIYTRIIVHVHSSIYPHTYLLTHTRTQTHAHTHTHKYNITPPPPQQQPFLGGWGGEGVMIYLCVWMRWLVCVCVHWHKHSEVTWEYTHNGLYHTGNGLLICQRPVIFVFHLRYLYCTSDICIAPESYLYCTNVI